MGSEVGEVGGLSIRMQDSRPRCQEHSCIPSSSAVSGWRQFGGRVSRSYFCFTGAVFSFGSDSASIPPPRASAVVTPDPERVSPIHAAMQKELWMQACMCMTESLEGIRIESRDLVSVQLQKIWKNNTRHCSGSRAFPTFLLFQCANPRANYLLRVLFPDEVLRNAQVHDNRLWQFLRFVGDST